MLSYDVCLIITKDKDKNFSIARLQTDNIMNIKTNAFMNKENVKIIETKFIAKSQIILETRISEDFNGYCMIIEDKSIMVIQKNQ